MSRLKPRERRSDRVNGPPSNAREMIELVAAKLGGADGLAAWAAKNNENETAFWTRIFVRLLQLPEQVPYGVATRLSAEEARKKFADLLGISVEECNFNILRERLAAYKMARPDTTSHDDTGDTTH
jgi:hypothetical protein